MRNANAKCPRGCIDARLHEAALQHVRELGLELVQQSVLRDRIGIERLHFAEEARRMQERIKILEDTLRGKEQEMARLHRAVLEAGRGV